MLVEILERLRGYDKWIEVQALIRSSEAKEVVVAANRDGTPIYGWKSFDEIVYKDQSGEEHADSLTVDEDSPVFQLFDGKTLVIRYNPADPYAYYVPEQLRYEVNRGVKIVLVLSGLVAAVVVYLVLDHHNSR